MQRLQRQMMISMCEMRLTACRLAYVEAMGRVERCMKDINVRDAEHIGVGDAGPPGKRKEEHRQSRQNSSPHIASGECARRSF
eukprot:1829215-Pyramimonas_sp.AAC.2